MRIFRFIRRLRAKFYDGPAVFNYPGRKKKKGYRSPNVLIIQWLHAFTARVFTFPGFLLLFLSGAIFLVGATSLLMPAFLLSFMLLALFVVDIFAGWFSRPKVHIERILPESAPTNSRIRVEYKVRNKLSRSVWGLYVDTMPMPRWLERQDGMAYIDQLPAQESCRLSAYLKPRKRGQYELSLPVADSSFPFGLWRWGSQGPPTKPLMVYPEYSLLTSLSLPVGLRFQPGLQRNSAEQGNASEFNGCREYRYGDNPRHIHALSWARLREPIVKEFRDEYITRVAVILDTYPRPTPRWQQLIRGDNPAFEASLSLTASAVEYMVRQDYRIDFFGLGVPPLRGGGGRGASYLQTILHLLAGMKESEGDFPGIPEELVRELQYISAAVVILQQWDDERAAVVQALEEAGIGTRVILVDSHSAGLPSRSTYTQLAPRQILNGTVSAI